MVFMIPESVVFHFTFLALIYMQVIGKVQTLFVIVTSGTTKDTFEIKLSKSK